MKGNKENKIKRKFTKPNFAKLVTAVCFIQFFYVLNRCIPIVVNLTDSSSIAFFTATIGISGSISISSIVWYMKKSASEKGSQFQMENLETILKLKKKYKDESECMELLNSAEQDTISRSTNLVNGLVDEANTSPEIQTSQF